MSSRLTKFQISFTENGVSTSKDVEGDQFTVGRHPDNAVVFPYNQVSRQHLKVATFEDKVIILDLGSSNGTFVDGKRIPPQHHLEITPASKIQLGAGGPIIQIEVIVEEKKTNQIETHIAPPALRPGSEPQKKHEYQPIPEPAMEEMAPPPPRREEKRRKHRREKVEDSHSNLKLDLDVKAPDIPLVMTAPAPMPEKPPTYQQKEKEFEKIITDARKHANKILHDAEMKAEEIAQKAHQRLLETEERADKLFEDRMQEAHQEAERFSKDAREETLHLLQESRAKAQAIRDQAQEASRTMRDQTEKKCQELISIAEKQGHHIKDQRLAEADEIIEQKGIDLLRETREQVANEKAAHAEKIASELKTHQETIRSERHAHVTSISAERKTHEDGIARERKAHEEALAQERKTHETNIARERKNHTQEIEKERKHHADEMLKELKEHRERIQSLSAEIESIEKQKSTADANLHSCKAEVDQTEQKLNKLEQAVKDHEQIVKSLKSEEERQTRKNSEDQRKAKDELQILMAEVKKQTEKRDNLTNEFEKLTALVNTLTHEKSEREHETANQLQVLKAKFEEEKARLTKQEEDRANALKLEAVKSVQKLEKELIDDIIARKSEMARAILLEIEATCQSLSVNRDWKNLQMELQEHIQHVLSSSKPTLDQKADSKQVVRKAVNQRRREKLYAGVAGFAMCAAVLWSAQYIKERFYDPAPLSRMVASAADARKEDLKARRYNPKQTADVKDTYVDSILFTKGFADTYTDTNYQNEWSKAATLYLLKTWRIDEDKSNKVLAMSAALVSQLKEKREAIHPDFIKKGIEQMRELETTSLNRMKAEIGGEVRLESFKKFEKKFFEKRQLSN